VLEWGAATTDDIAGSLSPNAIVIAVQSSATGFRVSGFVDTLFAGSSNNGGLSVNGVGTSASFAAPFALAADQAGNLFVTGSNNIRKIVTATGVVSTLSLTGPGTLSGPQGIIVDSTSTILFVADTENNLIRKIVLATGAMTTHAGNGGQGSNDGPALMANFYSPCGLALDSSGTIFVADQNNNRVRMIKMSGPMLTVTTLAGSSQGFADGTGTAALFNGPYAVAVDSSGNVYVSDLMNNRIRKIVAATSVVTTLVNLGPDTPMPMTPQGLVLDGSGCLFVADNGGGGGSKFIRKVVLSTGEVSSLPSPSVKYWFPHGITIDPNGNIFVSDTQGYIHKITAPPSIVFPVCDATWHHLAIAYSAMTLTAFVDGALVAQASVNITLPPASASTLRVGWSGSLLYNNGSTFTGSLADLRIYSRALSGTEVGSIALLSYVTPKPMPSNGSLCPANSYSYVAGSDSCASCAINATLVSSSLGCRPTFGSATDTAFFLSGSQAEGAAAFFANAPNGLGYVADSAGAAAGALSLGVGSYLTALPAAGSPLFSALPVGNAAFSATARFSCAASLLPNSTATAMLLAWGAPSLSGGPGALALAVRGPRVAGEVATFAGSGVCGYADGVRSAAQLCSMFGLAVDAAGTVFIGESGGRPIRKISPSGSTSTFVGKFASLQGMAVDAAGNIYATDSMMGTVSVVSPSGSISIVAGSVGGGFLDGPTTGAKFSSPFGIAFDSAGNLFLADHGNNRIRKLSISGSLNLVSGITSTLAGSGAAAFADGTGTAASFYSPTAVAVDTFGNVFVTDSRNFRIRKVTPTGVTTTIAGNCNIGYCMTPPPFADGLGTSATFAIAQGIAIDSANNLFVADTGNNCIRKISPSGMTTTIAGSATASGFAEGIGTSSLLSSPNNVAVDSSGNVYVTDQTNNRIRIIYAAATSSVCDSKWHSLAITHGDGAADATKSYLDSVLT
jgi:hypothetical protein